jgi:drug/metabolite transporter (DMT)-like permease
MKTKIWLALLTVYIVWGSTYLAIRFAVESMPPFLMAATRFLVAGGVLFAAMRLSGAPAPNRRHWLITGVVGLFLLLGGNGLVSWAEMRVTSGVAALMVGGAPLWMVLVDALRPGGIRPTRRTLIGVLVGFAGIAWLVSPAELLGSAGEGIDTIGAVALAFASLFWAVGSIFSREHKADLPAPLLATSMEMLVGGAGLLLFGTFLGEWGRVDLAAVSTRSLLGLGYLIVFGSLVGYSAYTWLLGVAPTPLVSTYAYVNPLVAVFMGFIFAAEPLTPRVLGAAVIILSSVVIINTARRPAPATPKPTRSEPPTPLRPAVLPVADKGARVYGSECGEGVD